VQTLIGIAVPVINFALLVSVGLDLTWGDFGQLRRQPAVVLTGLIGPLLLLPPVALLLVWAFQPSPAVTAGLLLVTACPIGGISNTFSYLARASTALSVTLTGLSCLLAGVTLPAVGKALELALGAPVAPGVPVPALIIQILVMFTLPVGLGMWILQRWPEWAARSRPAAQRLAFAGVGVILVLIVLDNPAAFLAELPATVPIAAAFVACSAAAGWMAGAAVTADLRDRFTLAAEFGARNLGVALAVAVSMLGRVEFARFAYTYFLIEVPLLLCAVALFRRRYNLPALAA